jgi:hypothetical protein
VALELAAVERLRQGTCGCCTTCEINLTVTAEVVTGRHHERAKAGSVLAALGARGRRRPGSTLTQGTLGPRPALLRAWQMGCRPLGMMVPGLPVTGRQRSYPAGTARSCCPRSRERRQTSPCRVPAASAWATLPPYR